MVTCVTHTQYRVFIAICGGDVLFTHFKVLVEIMGGSTPKSQKNQFHLKFLFWVWVWLFLGIFLGFYLIFLRKFKN